MGQIRTANRKDEECIYKLLVELENTRLNRESFAESYACNLANPQIHYLVYEEEQVVGFMSVHMQVLLHHTGVVAEIQELVVTNKMQGQGIGTELFKQAVTIAKEKQAVQLEVCCNQRRLASHSFYERQGMTNHHYKFCLTVPR